MPRFLSLLCALMLPSLSLPAADDEVVFSENFGSGTGQVVGYRGNELLETAKEGDMTYLRVTPPGEKLLEGMRLPMGGIQGDRLLVVTARLRGRGTVGPMIQAANGWTRLEPITLSGEWREIKLPKALQAGANNPTIYFVTMPMDVVQQGAVFEIADIKAELAPPMNLESRSVPPTRYEAEDFAMNPDQVREVDQTRAIVAGASMMIHYFPYPQTSEKVTIYVRYRPASDKDRVQLTTQHGGANQAIREVTPEAGGWQWIAFRNLTAGEVGAEARIVIWPKVEGLDRAALDAFVITTELGELSDEALNALR